MINDAERRPSWSVVFVVILVLIWICFVFYLT